MRARLLLWATLAASLLFPWYGWAQRNADTQRPRVIRGQLRLPSGSSAPQGIQVELIHREGDMVTQSQTDSSGKFFFDHLSPAIYRIRIHAPGFQDIESQDLDTNINPMAYLSLELKPLSGGVGSGPAPGATISADALKIPDGARKEMQSGEELLQKGDYAKGIESFQKAVKAYPAYADAYLMMGIAYRAQNDADQASAAFQKCIELNPGSAAAYAALGEIQNNKKEYGEAEKNLVKAVGINPEFPQAQLELARAYWAQQRWQDAEPHASKALALAPDNAPAHLMMGNISLRKRDGAAALQHFREYLKLDPQGAAAPSVREMVSKLEKALGQQQTP